MRYSILFVMVFALVVGCASVPNLTTDELEAGYPDCLESNEYPRDYAPCGTWEEGV